MTYTYCPISHEVKTTRQWNLVKYLNITIEKVSFKYHAENKAGRLVPNASGLKLIFNIFW